MILTFGFLAGPAKIHPEAFASVQQHRGYLSEEFQNSRMLCVSLVMLLSARQYSLECDLQKFGENDMIHMGRQHLRKQRQTCSSPCT